MVDQTTRVVLDTNVLVSAVLFGGPPERVLQAVRAGRPTGVTSLYILSEFQEVLTRPKFGIPASTAEALAVEIAGFTEVVAVEGVPGRWTSDPDDDPIVATALVEGATHIVTGDRTLLQAQVPGVLITRPAELLEILEPSP